MESLALIVSLIFLTVLFSGPLAVLSARSGASILGGLLGLLAVVSGTFWLRVAPIPIGLVGAASAAMGLYAISRVIRGID